PATGKVMLSGPAPAGGASVRLLSDHGAGASLPDSVLVPAGATGATFPIRTQPVEFPTYLRVDAEYGGSTVEAALQVVPLGGAPACGAGAGAAGRAGWGVRRGADHADRCRAIPGGGGVPRLQRPEDRRRARHGPRAARREGSRLRRHYPGRDVPNRTQHHGDS